MKKSNIAATTKRQLIKKSGSTVVIAMAISAIIVAFSLVTINYLWDLSQHNKRVIKEKSAASNILEQNVENIELIQNNFTVLEAGDTTSAVILDALPSKYDFPALTTSLESLVKRSGLTLNSFSGDDEEDAALQIQTQPAPIEIPFTLNVSGSYSNIQKFVKNLEVTIRPMKIVRMELKGSSDSAMKATVSVITYYQPATSLEVETRILQ